MKIIEIAEKEIGQVENPPNSNKTKYGKWFGIDGSPWCGMFVSWVYAQAGFPLGKIQTSKGFAGCQFALNRFRETKRTTILPYQGDLVFFDWNQDGRVDHVGIFVRKIDNDFFETIEGNTSPTNDSNGGQVMRRRRRFGKGVFFVHPECLDNPTSAS